jgi:predicted nucleic acid-binding protein
MAEDDFFKGKSALLDTNILSEMAKSKRAEKYRSVFEFLENMEISPFILDATRFEFIGFSTNKKDYDFLTDWIKQFPVANTRPEDVDKAILLSSLYRCKDPSISPKQISFCDCLHAVQLLKYEGRAFVITTDVHDYPLFLFDIEKTFVIDENGKAVFVGFITYNEEKWKEVNERFEKSGVAQKQ